MKAIRFKVLLTVAAFLAVLAVSAAYGAMMPGKTIKGPVARGISARPETQYKVHDVGYYWCAVSNFGNYGEPNSLLPSGEWPAGSEVYYVWEGRFWVSAIVGGEQLCSHSDYGNYELDPSDGSIFYFGAGPKSIQDGWTRFDDKTTYQGHTPIGYEMSQRSLAWSLSDYDDFIVYYVEVKNASGGTLNGGMVTWVFDNDCGAGSGGDPTEPHIDDLVDYDGWAPDGENIYRYDIVDPLDLDGDELDGYDVWGWPLADENNPYQDGYTDSDEPENFDPEPDGIYDECQIYLDPGGPYIRYQMDVPEHGIVAGEPVVRFHINEALEYVYGDTLRGYLLPRNMSYMMDGDYPQSPENDAGERHLSVPVSGFIGTRVLYIPHEPFYDTEDDTLPRPYSHQWWNWQSDPGSDQEKYEYMIGSHTLSSGMKFMPHPFDYGGGAPVFDYRYMITTGPFNNWQDGEIKKFVMVTGAGQGLKGLRENSDNALVAYYKGDPEAIGNPGTEPPETDQLGFYGASHDMVSQDKHFLLPIPPPTPNLQYSAVDRAVELLWDNAAETTIDNLLQRIDFSGYKVYRAMYSPADWEMIAAFDNIDGPVYLKNIEGDTLNPVLELSSDAIYTVQDERHAQLRSDGELGVDYEWVMIDLPPGNPAQMAHRYNDIGGDFKDVSPDNIVIFSNVERPVNGLKYYYAVTAFDEDKYDDTGQKIMLPSIESSRSNYHKNTEGAPEPVIPRPDVDVSSGTAEGSVDDVRVVPNPYKGTAVFESRYEDRIAFFYLPARCKISIFTMTGDLVDEIYHNNATSGAEYWDLISRNNQKVVSGLYLYVVETPDGDKKIDKFLIIR